MAKKQSAQPPAKKAKPSKPPKGTGGGGAQSQAAACPEMDSGVENFSALEQTREGSLQAEKPVDPLAAWEERKAKLNAARKALRELPESEYEELIRDVIRTAPTSWHVRMLIMEAVRSLKFLSAGANDTWRGIPKNDPGVIGRIHYQLARITREFNVSLTAKSTPNWLLKAKEHPEFQRAWKEFSNKKREHERGDSKTKVIEVDSYGGQLGTLRLRCVFEKKQVRMEWRRGGEITRQEIRPRISSNGVLQHWLADVLKNFDEWIDYPDSPPLAKDWAERWADEALYMKHFIPHAEREWNPDKVDELQAMACGLLTPARMTWKTKSGKTKVKLRYDFGAFKTRIKRLALKQIRWWRDGLVPPVQKVSRK
jgi:hypothetical protein